MNTIPERAKEDRSEAPVLSRLARWRKERKDPDYFPQMPPVEGAGHLIGYLYEVGPTIFGEGGEGPLSNLELRAWMQNLGFELQPWEARFLLKLSREHLDQTRRAAKLDCEAPWHPEDFEREDLKVAAETLKQSMRELANL